MHHVYITSSHGHTIAGVEIDYKTPIGYQGVNLNALGLYKDLLISVQSSPIKSLLEHIIFTSDIRPQQFYKQILSDNLLLILI